MRDHSISGAIMSNAIGHPDKLYAILKPFGYDFPEIIMESGMMFEICDISDAVYTEGIGDAVKPIISSQAYTSLYKDYIKRRRNKIVSDS